MQDNNSNFLMAVVLSLGVLLGWQFFVVEPRLAEERARQAGATTVRITMSEDVKLVPLSADRDMFIEALVYATADGTAN